MPLLFSAEEKSDLFFRHLIWFHLLMSGKILYCHWGWMEEKWTIADEMGLAYSFQPVELEGAHENTVMMKFYQDDKLLSTITGSSIGGGNIIITNIDGFDIQFSGKFTTIILKHRDQKGIVGEVGTTLLADRINIANMSLNRTGKGLEATTIIETDEPVSDHTIELLKQIEGVLDIMVINI